MSIDQAQAFMEKVKNDEDLAKRLNEVEDSESRLNIAKELGYEFTLEEARQANERLSDEELEQASAGSAGDPPFIGCYTMPLYTMF